VDDAAVWMGKPDQPPTVEILRRLDTAVEIAL
jgi:hypothetical protein